MKNINAGQILPINYGLWPEGSESIIQAMVMQQTGDMYEMCPVHTNIDAAGFFDLIVRGSTIASGIDMVIMCRDRARFPAAALNIKEEQDPDLDLGPILTAEEGRQILKETDIILTHHDTKTAYTVLRGTALPANSDEKIWAENLRREWHKFRLASMCEAVRLRQRDLPGYLSIDAVLELAGKIIKGLLPSLIQPGADDFVYASGASVKRTIGEEEGQIISSLQQRLKDDLKGYSGETQNLKHLVDNEDPADLLEAVLHLYQEREI